MPKEKVQNLESILKKRSGVALPPTHQVILDLKIELANAYDSTKDFSHLERRIDIIRERLEILHKLEGDVDSRLKGFLLFRLHNLLVARVAFLHKKQALNGTNMTLLGQEMTKSLVDSARMLHKDHGCPPQLIDTISQMNQMNGNDSPINGNHASTNGNH